MQRFNGENFRLAARPATLAGSRVALLDITKRQGAQFLDRIAAHLHEAGAATFRLTK
ncbi:MAG: UGSC family (seleno)protein, partial [Solirubrobacteraceae bacterium]